MIPRGPFQPLPFCEMFYTRCYPWAKPCFFSLAEHREIDFRKEEKIMQRGEKRERGKK